MALAFLAQKFRLVAVLVPVDAEALALVLAVFLVFRAHKSNTVRINHWQRYDARHAQKWPYLILN
jgi:hypothetical protein